jgi:ABC-type cobalamin/Fe3+-siderophores transport system ATPase subunit
MRLLYLRLPEYGPLSDRALAFPSVDFLKRDYALHFVVGVNGTGKSSVLRALFRIFDCLARQEWPDFMFELAYQLPTPGESTPTTVHIARWGVAKENTHVSLQGIPDFQGVGAVAWRKHFDGLRKISDGKSGTDWINDLSFAQFLPAGVLAYTSGLIEPWQNLIPKPLDRFDLESMRETEFEPTERPFVWTPRKELEFSAAQGEASELVSTLPSLEEWRSFLRKPSAADPRWRTRLLDPADVRLAGLAVALKQAAHDLANLTDQASQKAQRDEWARQKTEDAKSQGEVKHNLRWLLTAAGLAWPTHIAFTFDRNARTTWTGDTSERLLLLYALAENVAPLPLGQERVVISLHHRDSANIAAKLRFLLREDDAAKLTEGNAALADLLSAVGTPRYGAEALARLLGGRHANALDAFRTLTFWRDQGLLIDATATFRRIENDTVVTYDQLSDGEQQLLQRGGLLLLLQGADDHLLLLDEPETHFNDRWKRELIDVIDDNLKSTRSHVILTTHSSIVLSDAFRDEILVLHEDKTVSSPTMPTFGADPGRILQHVFGSPDNMGQRAREELGQWLKDSLDPTQREDLQKILREVGAGYLRSKLWANLEATDDAVPRS